MNIIISASTGIGAATARLLASQGHRLFIVSRTAANNNALVDALGGQARGFVGDLTGPDTASQAVAACVAWAGRLDAVYNVAGISGRRFGDGPVHACSEEGWNAVMGANLTSMYRMCREAVRVMLIQERDADGRRGVILNMASILGLDPEPTHFATHAYAASKGGIVALTRAMAASYAKDGIRVNAIAPGLVRTPMSARASEEPEIVAFIGMKQPLTGLMSADDVAHASAFLLGSGANAITGTVLTVDGGWSLA